MNLLARGSCNARGGARVTHPFDNDGMVEFDVWIPSVEPMKNKKKVMRTIETDIYVVTINHENNGEVTVFRGNLNDANLIELGQKISSYKLMDKLPNWLDAALFPTEAKL